MAKIFMASWESRDYLYQGFGNTPGEAKHAALDGYRQMCKRVSGENIGNHEVHMFSTEVSVTEIQIGKCLVDHGRQGWIP